MSAQSHRPIPLEDPAPGGLRLRIVVYAPNMSFRMGGEAARPIHYARELIARGHDVRLITHERCRRDIAQDVPELVDRTQFVPDTSAQRLVWRLTSWLPERLREFTGGQLLKIMMDRTVSSLLESMDGVDLVHKPIPISPRILTVVRTGRPFVLGPLNGDISYPPAFASQESWITRGVIALGRRLAPSLHRLLAARPTLTLVSNDRTARSLPVPPPPDRLRLLRANAVDLSEWSIDRDRGRTQAPVRIATMSRLVQFKAIDVLIRSLAGSAVLREQAELVIIGDGPERANLQGLADRLGVSDRVEFLGWMKSSEAIDELRRCDVFAFPSLQEPGGAVVMEAACLGLPIVCADWGGPADYLPEGGGVAVAPDSREGYLRGFREAMEALVLDHELRGRMGQTARRVALEAFGWNHRVDSLEAIYREAIALHSSTIGARPGA
ncbi:glycosyltransferase family 4 protein [Tautonia sp. JC769]|uniref:glycosyltransferase family 4 protein n=1 Tax=Tautonia sp. JC769 TaxID=3232135 RepID=UPI00345AE7B8